MRPQSNAETEQSWLALRPELDAAIAQLPERYRNAVVLSYMEGRTTAEAGAILGVPQSTVTTWLDRGRQKLRELLARRGVQLNAAVLVTLLSSKLADTAIPASLTPAAIAAGKSLVAGTLESTLTLNVSSMLKGATKMLFWIKIKYACIVLAVCLFAGIATPLAIRAASEEKKDLPAPAPAPTIATIDASKPLDIGPIAYTGGVFTPDGLNFVYAETPKPGAFASELKAIDVKTAAVQSLGLVPLVKKPADKDEQFFKWSIGVFMADSDLATVYLGQFGPDVDMDTKQAFAWDVKKKEVMQVKRFPDIDAVLKERAAGLKNIKLTLKELDENAGEKRQKYVNPDKLVGLLGKKELSIEMTGAVKAPAPIDVTEAFKGLYAYAVAEFPKNRMNMDSGQLLESDSIVALAQSGKWILARAGIYVHYGIRGYGYGRVVLINTEKGQVIPFDQITSFSASGERSEPIQELFLGSPNGSTAVGMSQGHLTLYRFPD